MSYNKNLLPKSIKPKHYDLFLTPNTDANSNAHEFTGKVVLSFSNSAKKVKQLGLHASNLTITKAVLNKKTQMKEVTYNKNDRSLVLHFKKHLLLGENQVEIEFKGVHSDDMLGFYYCFYEDKARVTKKMVVSQFEASYARRCFPCIDEPDAKATFTVTLQIEKHLTALSNTPVETTQTQGKMKEVRFKQTPLMSTYILAFVVAELEFLESETKNGIKVRTYTTPGLVRESKFALSVGVKAMDIFDDLFGVHYPLSKLDLVAIPDFKAGAMENLGLVTFRTSFMLTNRKKFAQNKTIAVVIAHELAHQWFGNIVTLKWWDELWLNEGFASWFEVYCVDLMAKDLDMWTNFLVHSHMVAQVSDFKKNAHPVQTKLIDSKFADDYFDDITYKKGACVVQMMYGYLGHEAFMAGLRLYVEKHQFSNAETTDLAQAWGETSGLGSQVKEILHSWISQSGFPLLTVHSTRREGKDLVLEYEQKWMLPKEEEDVADRVWMIPMCVLTETGEKRLAPLNEAKGNFIVKDTTEELFKLNSGHTGFFVTNYSETLWRNLGLRIKEDPQCLSRVDRVGMLFDLSFLTRQHHVAPHVALAVIAGFDAVTDLPEARALFSNLNHFCNLYFEHPTLFVKFKRFVMTLTTKPMKQLGIGASPKSDSAQMKDMRKFMFEQFYACGCLDEELLALIQPHFDQFLEDRKQAFRAARHLNHRRLMKILVSLPSTKGSENFDNLLAFVQKNPDQVGTEVLTALASVQSMEKQRELLEWALTELNVEQLIFIGKAIAQTHPTGGDLVWNFFKDNFEVIEELREKSAARLSFGKMILDLLSGTVVTDAEKEVEVRDFLLGQGVEEEKIPGMEKGFKNELPLRWRSNEVLDFLNQY